MKKVSELELAVCAQVSREDPLRRGEWASQSAHALWGPATGGTGGSRPPPLFEMLDSQDRQVVGLEGYCSRLQAGVLITF